jgi:hypothetical protein
MYAPDPGPRLAYAEEALATARTNGDPFTLGNVLSIRHNVVLSHETIEQRRRENEELVDIAERVGDPNLLFYSRTYGYFWRMESGDVESTRTQVQEGREIASRLAQPMFDWILSWMESGLARVDGDLDAADAINERALEIGTDSGIPDAAFFHAVIRITLLEDRADPATCDAARALFAVAPPHYFGVGFNLALLEISAGDRVAARERRAELGASSSAPWIGLGGPPDSRLSFAAHHAYTEAALGEASDLTRTAYDYTEPWRGQYFGNIAHHGPTEIAMASIAPLCGHADELDALIDTGIGLADGTSSPIYAMYARIYCACGLRIRSRPRDRDRALRLVDEAIAIGDRIGAGFPRAAAAAFPTLRD